MLIFIFIYIGASFWDSERSGWCYKSTKSKSCESQFEYSLLFCLEGLPLILGGQEGGCCCCIRLENWIGSWDSPKQFLTAIVLIQQDWTNNVISFWEKGHMFFLLTSSHSASLKMKSYKAWVFANTKNRAGLSVQSLPSQNQQRLSSSLELMSWN